MALLPGRDVAGWRLLAAVYIATVSSPLLSRCTAGSAAADRRRRRRASSVELSLALVLLLWVACGRCGGSLSTDTRSFYGNDDARAVMPSLPPAPRPTSPASGAASLLRETCPHALRGQGRAPRQPRAVRARDCPESSPTTDPPFFLPSAGGGEGYRRYRPPANLAFIRLSPPPPFITMSAGASHLLRRLSSWGLIGYVLALSPAEGNARGGGGQSRLASAATWVPQPAWRFLFLSFWRIE